MDITDGFLGIRDFELGGQQFDGPVYDRLPEFEIGLRPFGLTHADSYGQLGYADGGDIHGAGDYLVHQPVYDRPWRGILPGFGVHRPVEIPGHFLEGHAHQSEFKSPLAREPAIEAVSRAVRVPADHRDRDFLEILPGEPASCRIEVIHCSTMPAATAGYT